MEQQALSEPSRAQTVLRLIREADDIRDDAVVPRDPFDPDHYGPVGDPDDRVWGESRSLLARLSTGFAMLQDDGDYDPDFDKHRPRRRCVRD